MEILLESFFNKDVLLNTFPFLLSGLAYTVLLSLIIVPGGVLVGFVVAFLYSMAKTPARVAIIIYIDFFRSIPPLVLLIFIYYGLPYAGIRLNALSAVSLAMILNASSYYSEIFRAGMESVPRGQREAARSSGLGNVRTSIHVVAPQAVRNVLPDLVGNTLEVVKGTSYASVVAIPELVRSAMTAQSITYNATPLIAATLLYLVILWPAVIALGRLERKSIGER